MSVLDTTRVDLRVSIYKRRKSMEGGGGGGEPKAAAPASLGTAA